MIPKREADRRRGPAQERSSFVAILRSIRRVLFSKTPAMDWAKGRLAAMVLTAFILISGVTGALDLAFPGFNEGPGEPGSDPAGFDSATGEDSRIGSPAANGERLRADLFNVPKPRKSDPGKQRNTKPIELLNLIELQGVMGGANPRAMVLYKRTRETVTVSVGDRMGEFTVVEIRQRSVVLKWRDETFELAL